MFLCAALQSIVAVNSASWAYCTGSCLVYFPDPALYEGMHLPTIGYLGKIKQCTYCVVNVIH